MYLKHKTMKVLHLFNEIKFSGAEIMYANGASLFQANGIEMLAFSTGNSLGDFAHEFERKNINTYHRSINPGINLSIRTIIYYWNFYKFLKSEKIEVLHIHRNDLYMVAICSRLAGIRTIKTMHSVFRNRKFTYLYGYFQRLIARKLLNVTFQTIGNSVFENELNYYKNPSVKINNWYDSTRFFAPKSKSEKLAIREKLGISFTKFVIISVGACSPNKNHSDILKAIALLDEQIDIHYLHLGTGQIESEEKKLAEQLGIKNKVSFMGNVNNVQDYLIASDVFVMSSKFEGLSIACIEAMACGKPLILYNSPGLRDLINNDNNGFLIDWDYKVIAEKIIQYLLEPGLIEKKGESALKFVNDNHTLEKNVNKIIALYKNAN